MRPLRILFMGTPDFAVPVLRALLSGPDPVIGVVCQPDRRKGRGKKLLPPPVKLLAREAGLRVLQPSSIRSEIFLDEIKALNPDLLVVAAYGKILPGTVLRQPPLGAINVHGSLLPKYRGAAPIQWALMNGEPETGVTIMQMDEGMDTGDILLTARLPITGNDTAGTLFQKLSDLGGETLLEAISLLKEGKLKPVKQDESRATEAPMLSKEQGHIDWTKSADELHCLIRGLDPWPSAYGFFGDRRFRFFRPQVIRRHGDESPGTICEVGKEGVIVAAGENALLIREIQPEGKKRMPAHAFLCGGSLCVGDQFT